MLNFKVRTPIVKVAPEPTGKEIGVKVGLIIATGCLAIYGMHKFGELVDYIDSAIHKEACKRVDDMIYNFAKQNNIDPGYKCVDNVEEMLNDSDKKEEE